MKILANYITPLWKGVRRLGSEYLHFTFGTSGDVFSSSLSKAVKAEGYNNLARNIKTAYSAAKPAVGTSFWKSTWTAIKTIPGDFAAAGKSATGFWAKAASPLKVLGKRMPLIGNIIMVAMELPNIVRAFSKGGVGTGVKEIGKAAVKIGGFAAGAAVGQALIPIPFVGAMVGGLIGGWLAGKVVGKSFTEKQKEAAEKVNVNSQQGLQPQGQQTNPVMGLNNQNGLDPSMTGTGINPFEAVPQAQIQQQVQPQTSAFGVNNPFATGMQNQMPGLAYNGYNQGFNPYLLGNNYQLPYAERDFMAMTAGLA